MRTTLELPDPLFRTLKARAALDGTTLKELMLRFVVQGLRETEAQPQPQPQLQPLHDDEQSATYGAAAQREQQP